MSIISKPINLSTEGNLLYEILREIDKLTAVYVANSGGSAYVLPTASTTVLGGVKVDGTTITIDGSGVISSVGGGGGWAVTGTTTITGDVTIDNDGNDILIGDNSIGGYILEPGLTNLFRGDYLTGTDYAEISTTLNVGGDYNAQLNVSSSLGSGSTSQVYSQIESSGATQAGMLTIINLEQTSLIVDGAGSITLSSDISTFPGATYTTDYSANFGNRSLVDKEYADSIISDVRLKKNIQYIDSALDQINKLRPATFEMIKDDEFKAGFIAQELNEVFPEMVITKDNGYLAIKKEQLVPYLVAAIQELSREIEILKNK